MSTNLKPITIIGGGLAGLTLGIGLRRLNIPVTIWEAGHYPRHRVCGEFISGKGQNVLARMNLLELFRRAGATLARNAKFYLGTTETPLQTLDPPALCLSRFTMDQLLAERFQSEGGELRQNARWDEKSDVEGIIRASGRLAKTNGNELRWFGLKVHAQAVELEADLEMHGFSHGYVGLCRLPGGEINICGLFRARCGLAGSPPRELLRGVPDSVLYRRMETARFDEASFCSVAGISLQPQHAAEQTDCRLGDALTMIPPVTGNGMSMALEAAELALEPIQAYASGELSWKKAQRVVAQACDSAFRRRLLWAKWLQTMMFSPALRGTVGQLLLSSRWLWQLVFTRTR
jgi:flavin-dependent dehydrogenase